MSSLLYRYGIRHGLKVRRAQWQLPLRSRSVTLVLLHIHEQAVPEHGLAKNGHSGLGVLTFQALFYAKSEYLLRLLRNLNRMASRSVAPPTPLPVPAVHTYIS